VPYASVASLAAAAPTGAWDVAFLAIDQARSGQIAFTAPYMEVDNTYLLPPGSSTRAIADVDRPGVRIAVQRGNAPDLHLARTLKHALLVRAENDSLALEMLQAGKADAMASGRGVLVRYAAAWPGARVLDERIVAVQHALAIPKSGEPALGYLRAFVEDAKRSGVVGRAIARNGLQGVRVAPAATD
jgi:polar amino acid transport system substrate-binding protein